MKMLLIAGAIASSGLAYGMMHKARAEHARHETTIATNEKEVALASLRNCGIRLTNIIEDLESDREIDALPDAALTDVPDHWLLSPDTGSAGTSD